MSRIKSKCYEQHVLCNKPIYKYPVLVWKTKTLQISFHRDPDNAAKKKWKTCFWWFSWLAK